MMENEDSLNEVFTNMIEAIAILEYHLGSKYKGDIWHQYFVRWFEKAKKIDKRTTFFWIKKNRDRFDEDMLRYAQSFYKRSIFE